LGDFAFMSFFVSLFLLLLLFCLGPCDDDNDDDDDDDDDGDDGDDDGGVAMRLATDRTPLLRMYGATGRTSNPFRQGERPPPIFPYPPPPPSLPSTPPPLPPRHRVTAVIFCALRLSTTLGSVSLSVCVCLCLSVRRFVGYVRRPTCLSCVARFDMLLRHPWGSHSASLRFRDGQLVRCEACLGE
jgi:hypothetical protein